MTRKNMLNYVTLLRDDQWELLESLITAKNSPGIPGQNDRLFIEAVLFIVPQRYAWSELSEEFGNWRTIYMRYQRWCDSGTWRRLAQRSVRDTELQLMLEEIAGYADEYLQKKKLRQERADRAT